MVEIVTFDVFRDMLWVLNPVGDDKDTYTILCLHLKTNGMSGVDGNVDGKPITFDLILRRYTSYKNMWMRKFGKRDSKYISAKDQFVSIKTFLVDQLYRQSYEMTRTPRDRYLFHDLTDDMIDMLGREEL